MPCSKLFNCKAVRNGIVVDDIDVIATSAEHASKIAMEYFDDVYFDNISVHQVLSGVMFSREEL